MALHSHVPCNGKGEDFLLIRVCLTVGENLITTMRDKSVDGDTFLSEGILVYVYLFNYYCLAQKTTPLPTSKVGFPIAQTMTTLNVGEGV